MNFDGSRERESLVGVETMAARFHETVEGVELLNQLVPVAESEMRQVNTESLNNVVGLSQVVDKQPTQEEYLQGLKDVA